MKNILLVPNIKRDPDLEVTKKIIDLLKNEYRFVLNNKITNLLSSEYVEPSDSVPIDFAITLGGDGTILQFSTEASSKNIPILGINLGKVGYMTALECNEIEKLSMLLHEGYSLEERMMESVEIIRDGKVLSQFEALNDMVIKSGTTSKMIDLDFSVNGTHLYAMSGDGVVVATPTGSTAYSMSAGGPIVEPTSKNLLLTPICAFALHARSFVFSPDHEIEIKICNIDNREVYLSVDGRNEVSLNNYDIIKVKISSSVLKLIRFKKNNFYQTLTDKLLPGNK